MSNTGKDLVDHWSWAAEKGLLNGNTAGALRAACAKVLEIEEGWEDLDVTQLDVDSMLKRFRTLRAKEYKPESLKEYERRFRKAHASYLDYVENPTTWKAGVQERSPRNGKPDKPRLQDPDAGGTGAVESLRQPRTPAVGFEDYPFPLRAGRIARMSLPTDITASEVKRITAFLGTLVVDEAQE